MALASKRLFSAVLIVAALAVAAGCGSDSGSNASTASNTTASAKGVTISSGKTDAGVVLVGAGGKTVYLFKADKSGKPTCDGACAAAWPPVVSEGDVKVAGDAEKSKLGSVRRGDGTTQVTYAGWPLYYYVSDTKSGDATGNGTEAFGAEWYALTPAGEEAEESGSGGDRPSSSSGY
jgi:predicted lipoprotein with Yx(FWY)xxD motif